MTDLALTTDVGVADSIVDLQTPSQGTARFILRAAGGTTLPPGDFDGQTISWDAATAAWIPTPNAGVVTLRSDGMASIAPSATQLILTPGAAELVGERAQMNSNLGSAAISVEETGITLSFSDGVAPGILVLANATGLSLTSGSVVVTAETSESHFVNGQPVLTLGPGTTVGFLGAAPVTRRSITGLLTQQQVDSIVAALVALGLATDNR